MYREAFTVIGEVSIVIYCKENRESLAGYKMNGKNQICKTCFTLLNEVFT